MVSAPNLFLPTIVIPIEQSVFSKEFPPERVNESFFAFMQGVIAASGGYPWSGRPRLWSNAIDVMEGRPFVPLSRQRPTVEQAVQQIAERTRNMPAVQARLAGLGIGEIAAPSVFGEVIFAINNQEQCRGFSEYVIRYFEALNKQGVSEQEVELWNDMTTGLKCSIAIDFQEHKIVGRLLAPIESSECSGLAQATLKKFKEERIVD